MVGNALLLAAPNPDRRTIPEWSNVRVCSDKGAVLRIDGEHFERSTRDAPANLDEDDTCHVATNDFEAIRSRFLIGQDMGLSIA